MDFLWFLFFNKSNCPSQIEGLTMWLLPILLYVDWFSTICYKWDKRSLVRVYVPTNSWHTAGWLYCLELASHVVNILLITLNILFSLSAEQSVTMSCFISHFISSSDTWGTVSQPNGLPTECCFNFFCSFQLERGFAYVNFTNSLGLWRMFLKLPIKGKFFYCFDGTDIMLLGYVTLHIRICINAHTTHITTVSYFP